MLHRFQRSIAGFSILAAVLASSQPGCRRAGEAEQPAPSLSAEKREVTPVIPPQEQAHAAYAGSAACKKCHEAAYASWERSNHGLAEREFRHDMDEKAFRPDRKLQHQGRETEAFLDADGVARILTRGFKGERKAYRVVRVIGNDPLRQFLIEAPGGRLQTCDASYDPHRNEWFDVFGSDTREAGDWGDWTGQGMNWNAMCAACHNTRLRKNYEPRTNSYHTSMAEASVGCEACHGPMKLHVEWQKNPPPGYRAGDALTEGNGGQADPTIRRMGKAQMLETCAACHSRRMEVTGDLVPGESYHDHFALTVTDGTDTYYPDGQVRDENYAYASFLSSRMHHAGMTCGDCHEPHSNKPIIQGNLLCMRCHGGGTEPPAPVIVPETHSPCPPGTPGQDCVSCHMPVTRYMQRHPRHDHGFTIPDPLLTKEHGVPNACNRCHTEKSTDWALQEAHRFYGDRLDRPTRHRALLIARARRGDAEALDGLIRMVKGEVIAAWRASACHLLERWAMDSRAVDALQHALKDDSPLVREAALRVLVHPSRNRHRSVRASIRPLLDDPQRAVRVSAAWALVDELDLSSRAGRELVHMLDINADQPTGRMRLSQFAYLRGDVQTGIRQIRKAIEWDPNSPPFHHDLALLLNMSGDGAGAVQSLRRAIELDPREPEYRYKLALALAEQGDLKGSTASLEKTVELDPGNARAWYNLGLAYSAVHELHKGIGALRRGEEADPADPAIPYARATIHARLGEQAQAREAAACALQRRPDYPEALELLRRLNE